MAGATHGLIAAAADQSTGIAWSNVTDALIGPAASGTGIGTGQGNTTAIVSQAGCTSGAAYLCDTLVEGGYSDWYLPSSYELYILIRNGYAIGGFGTFAYWSSTEYGVDTAESRLFDTGDGGYSWKGVTGHHVRAIRAF